MFAAALWNTLMAELFNNALISDFEIVDNFFVPLLRYCGYNVQIQLKLQNMYTCSCVCKVTTRKTIFVETNENGSIWKFDTKIRQRQCNWKSIKKTQNNHNFCFNNVLFLGVCFVHIPCLCLCEASYMCVFLRLQKKTHKNVWYWTIKTYHTNLIKHSKKEMNNTKCKWKQQRKTVLKKYAKSQMCI